LVIGEILFVMKSSHPIGYRSAKADSRMMVSPRCEMPCPDGVNARKILAGKSAEYSSTNETIGAAFSLLGGSPVERVSCVDWWD
jgi:hypothetical protein